MVRARPPKLGSQQIGAKASCIGTWFTVCCRVIFTPGICGYTLAETRNNMVLCIRGWCPICLKYLDFACQASRLSIFSVRSQNLRIVYRFCYTPSGRCNVDYCISGYLLIRPITFPAQAKAPLKKYKFTQFPKNDAQAWSMGHLPEPSRALGERAVTLIRCLRSVEQGHYGTETYAT